MPQQQREYPVAHAQVLEPGQVAPQVDAGVKMHVHGIAGERARSAVAFAVPSRQSDCCSHKMKGVLQFLHFLAFLLR